jgi:hypothetical protein
MIWDKLMSEYPLVYRTKVPYGFWCPEDWYEILENLSADISRHLENHPISGFSVQQVKEKFGGLRFYVSASDDVIDDLIATAENRVSEYEARLKKNE